MRTRARRGQVGCLQDLHRLELRLAATRIVDGAAVRRLANSIHEYGQLVACIAAGEPDAAALVLIDGYRGVAALTRLGRDTVPVQCWSAFKNQETGSMRWRASLLGLRGSNAHQACRIRPAGRSARARHPLPVHSFEA